MLRIESPNARKDIISENKNYVQPIVLLPDICSAECALSALFARGTRLRKLRLVVTVRQSGFSHAVVEDTAYVGPSDVCGHYSCGMVRLASSRAEKSLADHLNGEYMTQICNFYPLPYPCSCPRLSRHPISLSCLYTSAMAARSHRVFGSPNFCPALGDLLLLVSVP